MYLATPAEIGAQLKSTATGRGATILHERKDWTDRAHAAGTVEVIPEHRPFTQDRLDQLAASMSDGPARGDANPVATEVPRRDRRRNA
ncbi:MAG: hypothetical protein RI988_3042 [Pseudomonadota bacterium]|jgi:hypothetical protein